MKLTEKDYSRLKQYGFKWHKDHCTDRVDAASIDDIVPAANGFTVIYKELDPIVLAYSTASVESIDYPSDLNNQWIFVNWINVLDERR